MEIIFKFDGNDSRQFVEAATKFAGAVQSFKPEDILDKVVDVLGFLAADGNKAGASSDAPAAENVRVAPDNPVTIMFGDVSVITQGALESAGILDVVTLSEYSARQLIRLEHMSDAGIWECRSLLAKHNLALRGDEA